ncbi:Ig-like domain-containing protein [Tritonibacter mobilis]|nr:Ig-like domain-containing protein [Tritonibacter mobilis]
MFVRFTADVPGIGRYDFDYGLYGVTGTVVKRDVVLTDPVPTVTLSGLSSTFINPQTVTATFSETVSGFDASDIQVTNATISSFAGAGATYTFTVSPDGPGAVTVIVPAGVATDSLSFPNLASNTLSGTAEGISSITADFTANPGFGVSVPHTVFFTDQSSSTPPALMRWSWDFGDGDTSTAQNPIHTYTSYGTYTATLETCVYTTCDTQSMTIEVVDVPATMTPSLSGFSGNVVGAQIVTVEFNAGVDTSDALQLSDFDATNLTLSNLSAGSPTPAYGQTQTYTLTATPDGDGAISLTLPAGAVSNYRSVANTASNTLSGFVDTTAPTITLVDAGASTAPYVGYSAVLEYSPGTIFVLGYSASVPGTVTLTGTSILPGNQMRYTIVPQRDGPVYVTFPAGMFRDVAGNFSAETRLDLGYADVDEPRPEITGVPASVGGEFEATITFSKTVKGFTGSDIQISGGTLSSFSGSGANYTARITPDGSASITVSVPADAAQHVAVAGVPGVFSVAAAPVSTVYNTTPVANAGPDQVVQSGAQITLDGSASSDPNGDTLAYHWSAPTGITLSDATAVQPNFTAPSPAPGDPDQLLSFTLTVDDGTDTHQDTVDVTVMAQVAATLAGLPSDITGPETITVDFSSDVTGFDETDLQLQNLSISNFASTSPSSYQFDVAPLARGSVSITLPAGIALDGRGNANVAASLSATGFTNTAPLADAGADQAVGGGVLITLDGSGSSDADGDSLTYLWTPPAGIVLSDVTAEQPSFTTPTPAPGDPDQVLSFTLTVDDGTETHQDTVDVTVMAEISATLAGLPSNITGSETITVDFSGDVTGFDETDLQLQNLSVSNFASTSPSSYKFDVAPLARGSVSITLPAGVAQDSRGNANVAASLSATGFTNTAPLADAGADQAVGGGVLITLDGSGSSDADGDSLTYLWTPPAGIVLSDVTAEQPSFTTPTPAPGDPDQVLSFTLTVDDGTETHQDTVDVTVMAEISATLAGLPSNITGSETITVDFSGDVTGFDETDLQLQNLALSAFVKHSPSSYQFDVAPLARGSVSITLPAGVAQDSRGNTNVAASLTATGFINTAPLAVAGSDQAVGGGVLITLDGSGSSDPDGDGLTYLWTAPAGITLSDATSVQPSFTAPTLSLGDPDLVLDFTLTVDDGTETHSDQIRITLRTDVSVTLTGLTDSFSGPGQHQIDIQFSRAVSGLTVSDLVVSGGEVQSLSGSGARYQALLLASGRGDLSVSLPAGVTHDNNGIPNAASNQMTALNRIIEQTSQLIAGFMQSRANNLISNQPRVADFLLGRNSENQLNASVTRGQVNMDMAVSPRGGAWASLRAAFSESDGQDSGYALAAVGRHIEVQPNLLLGAMLQMDYAESTEGPAEVEGYGWLIGPYAVYRLPDQPVIFSAQILYGQSQNEIAPLGTYRDQFKTERWLAQLGVTGEVISGDWTVFPFLTATHTRDDQRAYIDHLGNMIPVQGIRLTNVELGADFELQLTHQAGERVLTGGVSGIWSETSGSGAAALREPTYEGGRMRLELGYGGVLTNGGRFQFSAYGDGFGANDYSSYGIEASYSFAF